MMRGEASLVWEEEKQGGGREPVREAAPGRGRCAQESEGAQGGREARQGPARSAKGPRRT